MTLGRPTRVDRPIRGARRTAERAAYGPWRLVSTLGEGAMGVVHRVEHRDTGAQAALKTVPAADPLLLSSLRREVRALARLAHPGIVKVLDARLFDAEPWYAMELLEGKTLRRSLVSATNGSGDDARTASASARRERPPPAPDERDRLLRLFPPLCEALAFLHGEGVVHLDLKPDNIFLAGERPVLMDFGLAARAVAVHGREPLEVVARGVGTLAYIAPEQLRGDVVDARADIYALGCVLYEVIGGRPPFLGERGVTIMFGHLEREPPRLSTLVPDVPRALEALVHAMLAKAPRDRPGYASDVARALRDALGLERPARPPRPRDYLYRPELVGRADVLAQLTAELARAERGETRVVLLGGESGVGKTRLAVELAQRQAHGRLDVVIGECSPLTVGDARGSPLAPLADLFATLADRGRDRERGPERELLSTHGPVLLPVAPVLRSLAEAEGWTEPEPRPARAARARLVRSVRAVLAELTRTRPILLLVDDVQWADDLTAEVIESLASEPWDGRGLLLLATYRSGELGRRLDELRRAGAVTDIQVGRLDAERARTMALDMVGGAELPAAMVERVTDHGDGNPFFITEYLRAAVREGVLRRRDGRWEAHDPDGARVAALPLPRSIRDLVETRLERLTPGGRAMADIVAVLGPHFDATIACASFAGPETDALDALNELQRTQLLESTADGGLRFAHAKLHEATYARIPPRSRVALHAMVAAALLELAPWPDRAAELAHHLLKAGVFDRAIDHLEQAGLDALGAGGYAAALSFFEQAAAAAEAHEVEVSPLRRARWARCMGDARFALGDLRGGMDHARRALDMLEHPLPARGQGTLRAIGREVAARASRAAEDSSALEEAALAAQRVGECAYFMLDAGSMVAGSLLATSLASRAGADAKVAKAYAMLGVVVGGMRARGPSLRLFERAVRASERASDVAGLCFSTYARATADLAYGEVDGARPIAARALELARGLGDPHEIGVAETLLGHCEYWTGELTASVARFARVAEDAHAAKIAQHEAWGLYAQARSLVHTGECARASELCERASRRLRGQNDAASELITGALHAWALLGEGRRAEARDAASELVARMRKPATLFATIPAYAAACETWLALAEQDPAALDHAGHAARALFTLALGTPLAQSTAALYAGRVALARGDRAKAKRRLERAVRASVARSMPVDELLARAALARCLDGRRAAHEREQARVLLVRTGAARHGAAIEP